VNRQKTHIGSCSSKTYVLLGELNVQDWKMTDDHKSRGWKMQDWLHVK